MVAVNFRQNNTICAIISENESLHIDIQNLGEVLEVRSIDGVYIILFNHEAGKRINNISGFDSSGKRIWTAASPVFSPEIVSPWTGMGINGSTNQFVFSDGVGFDYPLESVLTGELGEPIFVK